MARARISFAFLVAIAAACGLSRASTFTFSGAGGSAWGVGGNWTPSGPPLAADTAAFDLTGPSYAVSIDGSRAIDTVALIGTTNPWTISGPGALTVGTGITGPGGVVISGGSLILSGTGNTYAGATTIGNTGLLTVNGTSGGGAITVDSGGALWGNGTVSGAVVIGDGSPPANGNPLIAGNLTVNGAMSFSANNTAYTAVPGGAGTIGTLTLNNARWSSSCVDQIDCAASGTNDLVILGNSGFLLVNGIININPLPGFASAAGVSTYVVIRTPNASGGALFSNTLGTFPSNAYLSYGFGGMAGGVSVTVTRAANIPSFAWTGGGANANWNQPGNWNLAGIAPIAGDTAAFDLTANPAVSVPGPQSAATINLNNAGSLAVNGAGTLSVANAIAVGSGQTLAGNGTINIPSINLTGGTLAGTLTVQGSLASTGGTIAPGGGGAAGTLSIAGSVALDHASVLNYEFGLPGTTGGGVNDLVDVTGNLSLDGTLNVAALSGFAVGTYRVADYTGTLSGSGLTIGSTPPSSQVANTGTGGNPYSSRFSYNYWYGMDTTVTHQVNLNVLLIGDFNGDGMLNSKDIDSSFWSRPPWLPGLTGQGILTWELHNIFHTNYGDWNLDGKVDFVDFQIMLDHWQMSGPSIGWAQGDGDGNGTVDFLDFQRLLDYWDPSGWNYAPSQTPEPASASLLLLGGLALLRRSRL